LRTTLPDPGAAGVIYLDHAATSWPKPDEVRAAVADAVGMHAASPGRGAHRLGVETSRIIFQARKSCASLLGVGDSQDIIFVPGCTFGMNMLLKGLIGTGDRVVVSSMEHNSVVRPLHRLAEERGVRIDVVKADGAGLVDADAVEAAVKAAPTRAVICQHVSNVTGSIQPVADIADIAHEAGALVLVDGAQAVGHLAVDIEALGVDGYACSGHKGLLGPQGVGVVYLAPGLDAMQLTEGGTGSRSEEQAQPVDRPERYESGTHNTPGISGIGAGARVIAERGEDFRELERRLAQQLLEELWDIPGLRVLGPEPGLPRASVVSVVHESMSPDRIAYELDERWGIAARAGLHCAPWAHRTVGSLDTGAVRFGIGWSNDDSDIETLLDALRTLFS